MFNLSNTDGYVSSGKASGKDRDLTEAFAGNTYYQDIREKANSVPIDLIFKFYNLNLNQHNFSITCPFKSHKGGKESTASFKYYAETNTFFCFGCRKGSCPCDFVSEMDQISKLKAAEKILLLFAKNANEDIIVNKQDMAEKLITMMNFSNMIRGFRYTYLDEKSNKFIEDICRAYDDINIRHDLDNEALQVIINFFQGKISIYTSCPQ